MFTFGIWNIIWVYRTTDALNEVQGKRYRSPIKKLLLCLFVPFYYIYWTYRSAQRVDALAGQFGIESDISKACLISAVLVPIAAVPSGIIQSMINEVACLSDSSEKTQAVQSVFEKASVMEEAGALVSDTYYYSSAKCLILGLATLGIWNFVWIYRTTKVLNQVGCGERRSPVKKLLLCMFLPAIYYVYWSYQSARRADALAARYNVDSGISIPSIFYSFLSLTIQPLVPLLIQSKLNEVVYTVNNVDRSDADNQCNTEKA